MSDTRRMARDDQPAERQRLPLVEINACRASSLALGVNRASRRERRDSNSLLGFQAQAPREGNCGFIQPSHAPFGGNIRARSEPSSDSNNFANYSALGVRNQHRTKVAPWLSSVWRSCRGGSIHDASSLASRPLSRGTTGSSAQCPSLRLLRHTERVGKEDPEIRVRARPAGWSGPAMYSFLVRGLPVGSHPRRERAVRA
jgi:hypothetical protein